LKEELAIETREVREARLKNERLKEKVGQLQQLVENELVNGGDMERQFETAAEKKAVLSEQKAKVLADAQAQRRKRTLAVEYALRDKDRDLAKMARRNTLMRRRLVHLENQIFHTQKIRYCAFVDKNQQFNSSPNLNTRKDLMKKMDVVEKKLLKKKDAQVVEKV
jgi:hypothetical protein